MRIYVASSWRCRHQPGVVELLRAAGHSVYDFQHPDGGDHLGFSWSEIDPEWRSWDRPAYLAGIAHPVAQAGFASDFTAMQGADACVLVLPCGRSAHLEAGWFVGARRRLVIYLPEDDPGGADLMYLMADRIVTTPDELVDALAPVLA